MPVYWRRDRKCWRIVWTDEDGRRRFATLTREEAPRKRDAQAECDKRATEAREIRAGLRRRDSRMTLAELVDMRRKWLVVNRKPLTVQDFDYQMQHIINWLGTRRIDQARQLNPKLIDAYIAELKGNTSARLINKRVGALKSVLRHAVRQGLLDRSPIDAVAVVADDGVRANVDKTGRRALSGEEIQALVDASPVDRRLLWQVYLQGGLRKMEAARLRRQDLDAVGCRLRIRGGNAKRKAHGEDVWQPIPQQLARDLAAYALTHQSEYLLPNSRGRMRDGRSILDLLRVDLKSAGVAQQGDGPDRSIDVQALRVTYLTRLVNEVDGLDIKTLQELARHTRVETTLKHYVRAQEDRKRAAVDVLSKGLG
jgi:integrase